MLQGNYNSVCDTKGYLGVHFRFITSWSAILKINIYLYKKKKTGNNSSNLSCLKIFRASRVFIATVA